MAKKWCYNEFFYLFLGGGEEKMKAREDKRMIKLEFNFLKISLFGYVLKQYQHIHFWVYDHPSQSKFGVHLVRGPKTM